MLLPCLLLPPPLSVVSVSMDNTMGALNNLRSALEEKDAWPCAFVVNEANGKDCVSGRWYKPK